MSSYLIQPDELLKVNVAGGTTVLDARPYEEYADDHIREAVNLHPGRMEESIELANGARVPHRLVAPGVAAAVLRSVGLSKSSRVVVYDEGGSYTAARLWWILTYLGHPSVRILDGGLGAWREAHGPVTSRLATPSIGSFQADPNESVIASFHDMLLAVGRSDVSLVNTLDEKSFEAGAIPGSVNLPYQCTFDSETGKTLSQAELFALFDDLDVEGTLIVYCGIGYTAAQGYLAARIAGFRRVKLYDGSLKDWSAHGGDLTPSGMEIDSE